MQSLTSLKSSTSALAPLLRRSRAAHGCSPFARLARSRASRSRWPASRSPRRDSSERTLAPRGWRPGGATSESSRRDPLRAAARAGRRRRRRRRPARRSGSRTPRTRIRRSARRRPILRPGRPDAASTLTIGAGLVSDTRGPRVAAHERRRMAVEEKLDREEGDRVPQRGARQTRPFGRCSTRSPRPACSGSRRRRWASKPRAFGDASSRRSPAADRGDRLLRRRADSPRSPRSGCHRPSREDAGTG